MIARTDDKAKTIAIEGAVTVEEILKFVQMIAPDDWKTWRLETSIAHDSPQPLVDPWSSPFYYGTAPLVSSIILGDMTYRVSEPYAGLTLVDSKSN